MDSDRESFTAWAASAQHRLLRTAVLITGDHHRAEDLVQEALTKVALRWRRLRDEHPEAYARRIIARDHISWWRRDHRTPLVTVGDDSPDVREPRDPAVERRLVLEQALATLTPRQRAVVVLRFYDDLSTQQTAEALGIAAGTVKSQTSVALQRLRERAPELADLLEETS